MREQIKINPSAKKIVDAIFNGEDKITINNHTYNKKLFKGTIVGFDIEGWRWIQQNPNKASFYAQLAQKGAKIVWVINLKTNTNAWRALIIDGVMHRRVNGQWKAFAGI
jgi:hypothetical protein